MLQISTEYFHDRRTADRGVPSLNGRPLATDPATFFGNADASYAETSVAGATVAVAHAFASNIELRSRGVVTGYDKFYQNVFPGAVNGAAGAVSISAYNHQTDRDNLFTQTDVLIPARTGRVAHRIATGVEIGRQASGNVRQTGYFGMPAALTTTLSVPLENPVSVAPMLFEQAATDADALCVAKVAAAYWQDDLRVTRFVNVLAGLRYDRFQVEASNHRTGDQFSNVDKTSGF